MLESKLVKHLEELNSKERERFRAFVLSPFFNQHQRTTELLQLILQQLELQKKSLSKEQIFKKLFPNQTYDEQKLHNVMSNLKKLLQRFFAQLHFEKQPLLEDIFTLEAAYERSRFDLLTNRAKQLEKQLENYPYRDAHYHFAQYRLNFLLGYYSGNYQDRANSDTLQTMFQHLDRYYMVEKMRNAAHLMSNSILMNTTYDFGLLEEITRYIDERQDALKSDREISLLLYRNVLLSLTHENDPQYYEYLEELFTNHTDKLMPSEKQDLYSFATNYCIRMINLGKKQYQQELFRLYQKAIDLDLVRSHGIISEWDYKNIATLGCSLKEFEWTESFLAEYQAYLLPDRRENAYNYNLANLYYNKKKYRDALVPLLSVKYTDVKYHINANLLLLRTYFAMRDTEALLSLIETLRIYIIRNLRITQDERRGYTNFLRFTKKLVTYKHQASTFTKTELQDKVRALKDRIAATENVINRYWLVGECEELLPKD